MNKYLLIILTIFSFTINAQTANTTVVSNLSAEQFKTAIANDKNGILIDLRTPDEIKKGFIKGAIEIDYLSKEFDKQLLKLDKNKTYYVYCAAGGRSGDCAELMEKQGFKKVVNLEKGFSDWEKKGFAVEKK
ncbi:MAG: rhodanese-like domain-containing protein [Bacteroidetes bacterium]|nr:rhodanese-like domain-containing protein [Bacteroidota bacterium]